MKLTALCVCTAVATLALIAGAKAADTHQADAIEDAVAVITPTKATGSSARGIVRLKQEKGYVQLTGQVTGLATTGTTLRTRLD